MHAFDKSSLDIIERSKAWLAERERGNDSMRDFRVAKELSFSDHQSQKASEAQLGGSNVGLSVSNRLYQDALLQRNNRASLIEEHKSASRIYASPAITRKAAMLNRGPKPIHERLQDEGIKQETRLNYLRNKALEEKHLQEEEELKGIASAVQRRRRHSTSELTSNYRSGTEELYLRSYDISRRKQQLIEEAEALAKLKANPKINEYSRFLAENMSSERLSQIYKHPNDPNASKVETAKSRAQRRNLGEDELTFQPKVNASSEVLAKDWISQPLEHRLFYAEQVKQKQKEQQLKLEAMKREMAECTFRPVLNPTKPSPQSARSQSTSMFEKSMKWKQEAEERKNQVRARLDAERNEQDAAQSASLSSKPTRGRSIEPSARHTSDNNTRLHPKQPATRRAASIPPSGVDKYLQRQAKARKWSEEREKVFQPSKPWSGKPTEVVEFRLSSQKKMNSTGSVAVRQRRHSIAGETRSLRESSYTPVRAQEVTDEFVASLRTPYLSKTHSGTASDSSDPSAPTLSIKRGPKQPPFSYDGKEKYAPKELPPYVPLSVRRPASDSKPQFERKPATVSIVHRQRPGVDASRASGSPPLPSPTSAHTGRAAPVIVRGGKDASQNRAAASASISAPTDNPKPLSASMPNPTTNTTAGASINDVVIPHRPRSQIQAGDGSRLFASISSTPIASARVPPPAVPSAAAPRPHPAVPLPAQPSTAPQLPLTAPQPPAPPAVPERWILQAGQGPKILSADQSSARSNSGILPAPQSLPSQFLPSIHSADDLVHTMLVKVIERFAAEHQNSEYSEILQRLRTHSSSEPVSTAPNQHIAQQMQNTLRSTLPFQGSTIHNTRIPSELRPSVDSTQLDSPVEVSRDRILAILQQGMTFPPAKSTSAVSVPSASFASQAFPPQSDMHTNTAQLYRSASAASSISPSVSDSVPHEKEVEYVVRLPMAATSEPDTAQGNPKLSVQILSDQPQTNSQIGMGHSVLIGKSIPASHTLPPYLASQVAFSETASENTNPPSRNPPGPPREPATIVSTMESNHARDAFDPPKISFGIHIDGNAVRN